MSEANGHDDNVAENLLEESSITMLDVLAQEKELEEEYAAVLGASDEKCCTYSLGAVKRQALYSCLTCCPESKDDLSKCAGICLACCYKCHENHDLIELYTKRNFRCDCPTVRLSKNQCLLNPTNAQPNPANNENKYNHNFQGLYCKCKRPYPDPERNNEEVMLQCAVCEDWYHPSHMEVGENALKLVDLCTEMICDVCMDKYSFLQDYKGFALNATGKGDSTVNVAVVGNGEAAKLLENEKLSSDLDESVSNIMKMNGDCTETEEKKEVVESLEPPCKRKKLDNGDTNTITDTENIVCRRPTKVSYGKGATFWGNDLRTALCACKNCTEIYKKYQLEFLLDMEDSAKSYEDRGMQRAEKECSSYEQGIQALASMDRVQQIDAITEYNKMKDKLKDFLHTFAVNKQVVTEEDIRRFFEGIKNEKNTNIGQPYFCR